MSNILNSDSEEDNDQINDINSDFEELSTKKSVIIQSKHILKKLTTFEEDNSTLDPNQIDFNDDEKKKSSFKDSKKIR